MPQVRLDEITRDTLVEVLRLDVNERQRSFVASNAKSLAQALFHQDVAWYRAIVADDQIVGFLMTHEEDGAPPFLWRMMIAADHQGRGIGRQAIELLCARLHSLGAKVLRASCDPADDGPLGFYRGLGFVEKGILPDDDEMQLELVLVQAVE